MAERGGSEEARRGGCLVMGPWHHHIGTERVVGEVDFGPDAIVDLHALQRRYLDRWVRGLDDGLDAEPPIRLFVMGENRWRDEDNWPLARAQPTPWFLRAGGLLDREGPADEPPDEFVYDPADPAPTVGGPTSLPAPMLRTNAGPLDQRKLEERADVLVYTSEPLDTPLEVTGPLELLLWAATTAPDTDFVAKLSDVAPDGFSRILAEGVLRARFRGGYERELPVEPGRPLEYRIDLVATSNVFLQGHRIRVIITSSSFPRFDRNPNTGHALGVDGPDDLRSARQTVFHDAARPSSIVLPVVPRH